jgi:hypothetical protein
MPDNIRAIAVLIGGVLVLSLRRSANVRSKSNWRKPNVSKGSFFGKGAA